MAEGFFGTFGLLFLMGMGIIMAIVVFLRYAKYGSVFGSIASTMQGGIPIIDKDGSGDIAELIAYDQHPETKLIRLKLNYCDKFSEGQTPYQFVEEDFYPALSQVAGSWDNYHGTIRLFWDFEHRRDYREAHVHAMTEQIKMMKGMILTYKRVSKDVLEYLEQQKVKESRKSEAFEGAKQLKALKSIVEEVNVDTVTPSGDPDAGMVDE